MSWEERSIDAITEIVTKGTTPSTYGYDFIKEGVNYIRAEGISKDGTVDEKTFLKISPECHQKLKRSQLKSDDILFSIAGMALGKTGIVKESYLPANTNQAVAIVRPIKELINPKFLQFQFINPNFYELVNKFSAQAAQPNINLTQLKSLSILIPPLQTQKRIADILSAYDDLIENNLKRIKLLEQAAQNIYKEWFVNLRFPGHENAPINEETGLPEGWEIGVVSDFGKVVTGKTPSTKRSDFYGGHIPFIKTPDMHGLPYVNETSNNLTELGQQAQLNKNLPANSVLVSCIGTAGVVAMTSKISQTNQQINAVVFDSTFKSFYFYCFAKTLKPLLEGLGSNGATMVNVNKGKFENIDLNIPTESLLVEYAKMAEPMFNQMLTLSIQNQKLKAARDILLPRLMNRTIEV